jgi:hypothetical protein
MKSAFPEYSYDLQKFFLPCYISGRGSKKASYLIFLEVIISHTHTWPFKMAPLLSYNYTPAAQFIYSCKVPQRATELFQKYVHSSLLHAEILR